MNKNIRRILRLELLGHHIYKHLSEITKDKNNKKVLAEIANDELTHYKELSNITGANVIVSNFKIKSAKTLVTIAVKLFGLTFVLKLFERAESRSNKKELLKESNIELKQYINNEEFHEKELLKLIDEESLSYMGSVVLGLNDALVELTGALAGFTLSIQNSRTIAILGLITGISAAFSMAASEYLSTKEDEDSDVNAKKASIYTGLSYVFTVFILILPYMFGLHYLVSLGISIMLAISIIAIFNYYISVAKDQNFFKRFREMALISIGVAAISFGIGFAVDTFIGI